MILLARFHGLSLMSVLAKFIDFPVLCLFGAIAVGIPSILYKSDEGIAFANSLVIASGTAYQRRIGDERRTGDERKED